jgi:outer membrane biosynthesis protein TonB
MPGMLQNEDKVDIMLHAICKKVKNTKWAIRINKSKDRQHKGQKKKDNRKCKNLQNTTQKTKDRATRTPPKTGDRGENHYWFARVLLKCAREHPRMPGSAREQKIAPETLKALWNPILLMYVKVQVKK